MGILTLQRVSVGAVGVGPGEVRLITTDGLTPVMTAGYLSNHNTDVQFSNLDIVKAFYSYSVTSLTGTYEEFTVSVDHNGIVTLTQWTNPGDVLMPVVAGDFANFNGTTGQIYDAGYSPTNAAKTKVVMANGATTANHIATYTDTAGTVGVDAATAINAGNIQAGLSGTAGTLASFPATGSNGSMIVAAVNNSGNHTLTLSNISTLGQNTVLTFNDPGATTANVIVSTAGSAQTIAGGLTISTGNFGVTAGNVTAGSSGHAGTLTAFPSASSNGSLIISAVNNAGGFATTISNSNIGQATVYSLPDAGAATANIILSASSAGTQSIAGDLLLNSNPVVVNKTVTATAANLATAGKVNIFVAPTGTAQIAILDIKVFLSTGLSGGGGNRLLSLADGTLVFNNTGITAALLGTPIFTIWGGTGNTLPSSSEATISTAGANVYLQYIGGSVDYASGSVIISVTYAQVTA